MKALILAGGKGTRLKQIVADRPKPMALVQGRPFLDYILLFLRDSGHISEITLSINYMSAFIKDYYSNVNLGIPISFIEEESPLGTGGAILNYSSNNKSLDPDFLVLNGDSLVKFDFEKLIAAHSLNPASATIVLAKVANSSRYGAVTVENERIIEFKEKDPNQCISKKTYPINAGIYLIRQQSLATFPVQPCSFEKDILPPLLNARTLFYIESNHPFLDIGIPDDYEKASNFIASQFD